MSLFRMMKMGVLRAPEGEIDGGAGGLDDQDPALDDPDAGLETDPELEPEPPVAAAPTKKPVTIPSDAIGKIRREERTRGERLAAARQERKARDLGYESADAMFETIAAMPKKTKRAAPGADGNPELESLKSQLAAATEENATLKQKVRTYARNGKINARKLERAENQLEVKEVEHELTILAVRSGVKDIDYAMTLARRHVAKMPEAERANFDPAAYFGTDLKKQYAHLYNAEEVPAGAPTANLPSVKPRDTAAPTQTSPALQHGAPPSSAGNPPAPGALPTKPDPSAVDARSMSATEFNAYLVSKGLTPPGGSLPM